MSKQSMPFAAAMGFPVPVIEGGDDSPITSPDPSERGQAAVERERCKRICDHAMKIGHLALAPNLMSMDIDADAAIAFIDSHAQLSAAPASASASPSRSSLTDRMSRHNRPGASQ